jgi:hypothetical protein
MKNGKEIALNLEIEIENALTGSNVETRTQEQVQVAKEVSYCHSFIYMQVRIWEEKMIGFILKSQRRSNDAQKNSNSLGRSSADLH